MSFFQPSQTFTTQPYVTLKGHESGFNFVPAINCVVLALGVSRIGGDLIVQDLHAGAFGVIGFFASLAIYLLLKNVFKRDANTPFSTTGVFAFSRNPGYVAFFLPLIALSYFDWQTSAAALVLYVFAMNVLVIHQEENDHQSAFGADFDSYRAATPRWLM
jgi:protein-S-isoprenylcysteine O-methyltransferase Ste14